MIALNKEQTSPSHDSVQEQFQTMLPQIHRQAMSAFRRLDAEARDELVAEVIHTEHSQGLRRSNTATRQDFGLPVLTQNAHNPFDTKRLR